MKYRYLIAIVSILALLCVSVYAAQSEYTISTGDDFISAKYGDDLDAVAEKLNMTPQDINSYFTKNGLIYLAVSSDNKTQVKISAFNDNFSSEVIDISYLDEVGLAKFVDAVSEDSDTPAQIVENNGRKYLCVKNTLSDSGGIYTVTQYITIFDGKTFYFSGYNPGEDTSDDITTVFNSFQLQDTTSQTPKSVEQQTRLNRQYILVNCGVVLFGAVALISIIEIIKSKLKTDKENDKNEN